MFDLTQTIVMEPLLPLFHSSGRHNQEIELQARFAIKNIFFE
jgi:hypothetical protein